MNPIHKPTLVIDSTKVEANIRRMTKKAAQSGAIFRPHFKTHQSVEVGTIFRKFGVDKITVSSVEMAQYFANNNWDDITIAFPVNLREMDEINNLASKITLNLLAESVYSLDFLEAHLSAEVGIFIKIDVGYHRTGLSIESLEIEKMINLLKTSKMMRFLGFLTHAGHSYHARGKDEILTILESAKHQLAGLKQKYLDDFPEIIISYGDTPSCSMAEACSGFDEIRLGNFVYYDVMQYHLGSCSLNDIAVVAACPVVATHTQRNEVVIYGGAVHLSKEHIKADNGFKLFGYVVLLNEHGWSEPIPGAYLSELSQEHGIIRMPEKYLKQLNPGDLVGILPVHSCLTANLLKQQLVI